MRTLLPGLILLIAGIAVGYFGVAGPTAGHLDAGVADEANAQASPADIPATATPSCAAGPTGELEVLLVPRRTERSTSGLSMHLGVQLRNNSGQALRTRYATSLVTDRGVAVAAVRYSPTLDIESGTVEEDGIATPDLPDGFYTVVVTAAGVGDGLRTVQESRLHIEARDGSLTPITTDDYYARSAANLAVLQ